MKPQDFRAFAFFSIFFRAFSLAVSFALFVLPRCTCPFAMMPSFGIFVSMTPAHITNLGRMTPTAVASLPQRPARRRQPVRLGLTKKSTAGSRMALRFESTSASSILSNDSCNACGAALAPRGPGKCVASDFSRGGRQSASPGLLEEERGTTRGPDRFRPRRVHVDLLTAWTASSPASHEEESHPR